MAPLVEHRDPGRLQLRLRRQAISSWSQRRRVETGAVQRQADRDRQRRAAGRAHRRQGRRLPQGRRSRAASCSARPTAERARELRHLVDPQSGSGHRPVRRADASRGSLSFPKLGVQDRPDIELPARHRDRRLSRRAALAARIRSHAQDRGCGRDGRRHRAHPLDRQRRRVDDLDPVPLRARHQRSSR